MKDDRFPIVEPINEKYGIPDCPWADPREADEWINRNLHRFLFPLEDIRGKAVEYTYRGPNMGPEGSGVYFLQWDGDVVYVGRAKNVIARLKAHWTGDKVWTGFWAIAGVPVEVLPQVEYMYLAWLRPILNSPDNKGYTALADSLIKDLEVYEPFESVTRWPSG